MTKKSARIFYCNFYKKWPKSPRESTTAIPSKVTKRSARIYYCYFEKWPKSHYIVVVVVSTYPYFFESYSPKSRRESTTATLKSDQKVRKNLLLVSTYPYFFESYSPKSPQESTTAYSSIVPKKHQYTIFWILKLKWIEKSSRKILLEINVTHVFKTWNFGTKTKSWFKFIYIVKY